MMAEVSSRIMSRFRGMEAISLNDGSVIYPFIQCHVLIDIHVYRYRAWIEQAEAQTQADCPLIITSTTLVTPDPTIKLHFPLQFHDIYTNEYLRTALNQLLSDNIISENFWDYFINTVTHYLRLSAGTAIKRRSGGLVLHIDLEVLVKEENSNLQRMFAHIDAHVEEFIDVVVAQTSEDYVPSKADSWWNMVVGFETVTFKTGEDAAAAAAAVCSICLEPYKEGVKIAKMPCKYSHWFHMVCILQWLSREWVTKNKKTCPICRWPLIFTTTSCFRWTPFNKYLH